MPFTGHYLCARFAIDSPLFLASNYPMAKAQFDAVPEMTLVTRPGWLQASALPYPIT
jgi:hypothetical protein